MSKHFRQFSGCYTCRVCGKKTRATGHDEESCQLCAFCYIESGLENSHSDNDGCEPYNPCCPTCNTQRPDQIMWLCKEYGVQPPKGEEPGPDPEKNQRHKPVKGVTARARKLYLEGELTSEQILYDHLIPMYEAAGHEFHVAKSYAQTILSDVKKTATRTTLKHIPSTIFFRGCGGGVQ